MAATSYSVKVNLSDLLVNEEEAVGVWLFKGHGCGCENYTFTLGGSGFSYGSHYGWNYANGSGAGEEEHDG